MPRSPGSTFRHIQSRMRPTWGGGKALEKLYWARWEGWEGGKHKHTSPCLAPCCMFLVSRAGSWEIISRVEGFECFHSHWGLMDCSCGSLVPWRKLSFGWACAWILTCVLWGGCLQEQSRAMLTSDLTWDVFTKQAGHGRRLVVPLLLMTPGSRWQGCCLTPWGAQLWSLPIGSAFPCPGSVCVSPLRCGCLSWCDGWHCYVLLHFSSPPQINLAGLSWSLRALNRAWPAGGLCSEVCRRKPSNAGESPLTCRCSQEEGEEKTKKQPQQFWILFVLDSIPPSFPLFCAFRSPYLWQLSLGVTAEAMGHDRPFYRQWSQPRTSVAALLFKSWSLMCPNNKSQEESHELEWKTPGCLSPPPPPIIIPLAMCFFFLSLIFFSFLYFSLSCFFFCILAAKLLKKKKKNLKWLVAEPVQVQRPAGSPSEG